MPPRLVLLPVLRVGTDPRLTVPVLRVGTEPRLVLPVVRVGTEPRLTVPPLVGTARVGVLVGLVVERTGVRFTGVPPERVGAAVRSAGVRVVPELGRAGERVVVGA